MFPPVPAPFSGSVPQQFAGDRRLSHLLDCCFGAGAIFTGTCAAMEAGLLEDASWQTSLGVGCLAMLPPMALGFWAIARAGALSSLAVTRLYDRVVQHLQAHAGSRAVPGAPGSPIDSFAGLVSGSVLHLKRSLAAQARAREAAQSASQALRAGREQAGRLAAHLRGDGAAMASAASDIMVASAKLADDAAQTSSGAASMDDTVAKVAEQAIGLAGSVRHVTGQIIRITEVAVMAAEAAMGAQAHLAGLDTRARSLETTARQVGRALQMAGACGRQAGTQAASGVAVSADLAANLQEMASCADAALTSMMVVITGLRTEAAAANRRVAELSALVQSQHELGDALSHAVGQQSEDVAHVLGLITVKEHYFLWEEGHRKAFYGEAMNLPLFNKLAEDYIVEPRGPGACAFTWRIAIEPSRLGKPGAPVNKLVFSLGFRDTSKHFRAA